MPGRVEGPRLPQQSHGSPHWPGHQKGHEQPSSAPASVSGREPWGKQREIYEERSLFIISQMWCC